MVEEEIVLNRELLKAIGADTRIEILKALRERQKTQSELAQELKLSAPTVLEHLDQLEKAGLVNRLEEGRKWKYYKLTRNAEKLLSHQRVHAVVLLAIGLLAALGVLLFLAQQPQSAIQTQPLEMRDSDQFKTSEKASAGITSPTADAQQGLTMEAAAIPEELDELNQTNQTKNESIDSS